MVTMSQAIEAARKDGLERCIRRPCLVNGRLLIDRLVGHGGVLRRPTSRPLKLENQLGMLTHLLKMSGY